MTGSLAVVATLAAWVAAGALDPGRVLPSGAAQVPPGGGGELSVTILEPPAAGVPIDVRIHAEGVRLVSERLGWADVVDPQARQPRLSVPFVAPQGLGDYTVAGLVTYVICEGKTCRTRRAAVAWKVSVVANATASSGSAAARETNAP
jgi:hypothetical protein